MARSRYDKYESTSDGVWECFSHLFLRAKGAVLKASLVKLFCFFFLATLATSPAQYLSRGLSYITAGKWDLFSARPTKSCQWLCNEIMQRVHIMPVFGQIHFKFVMTASISRTFWWYCVLSLKRWFWIQSQWIKPCLYSVSFPTAIIGTEMTTTTKKAFPVSILNERHPLFYEANVFFYDFCLTILNKIVIYPFISGRKSKRQHPTPRDHLFLP